jgi:hypothetical protein
VFSLTDLNTYALTGVTYTDEGTGVEVLDDRYKINGVIDTSNTVLDNIEKVCSAAGSWLSYDAQQGKWGVVINKAGTSVASFNDNNILGSISISGTGFTDLYNEVKVEFPHRDLRDSADFVTIEIPSVDRNSNELDNTLNLSYDIINEPIQAQMLGFIELKQSRVNLVTTFRTDYSYIGLNAGDIVDLTNSRLNFSSKLFRIIEISEVQEDGPIQLNITALEYDADVYDESNLFRYTRSDSTGILTIGSIGTPGTPVVTKIERDARPRITATSTSPTGIVEGLEFWITFDVTEPDDTLRSYNLIATKKPVGGGVFTSGTDVTIDYDSLEQSNFLIKTRGFNAAAVSPFSSPSGLVEFTPTQIPNALDPETTLFDTLGNVATLISIGSLLLKLDEFFGGDDSKSIFDKMFELFEDETGTDIVGDATGGTLVVESAIITKDEGVTLSGNTASYNFTGEAVTATVSGNDVTVNVDTIGNAIATVTDPEYGQTIVWNGSNWVTAELCCDVVYPTDPTSTTDPDSPAYIAPQCYMVTGNKYPPDRATWKDPITGETSDQATTTGSYYMLFSNTGISSDFYGNISAGSGDIRLYKSDGTLVETIAAASCTYTVNMMEIPFSARTQGTDYYILMDEGVAEYCDCISPAITDPTFWNFNTPLFDPTEYAPTAKTLASATAVTAPQATSISPSGVDICANGTLTITFDDNVENGTGTVSLFNTDGDVLAGTFTATGNVEPYTTSTLSFGSIANAVSYGQSYYITADAGVGIARVESVDCFEDETTTPTQAIVEADGFGFTTVGALTLIDLTLSSNPFSEADDTNNERVNRQSNLGLKFNRSVALGESGFISVYKFSDDSLIQSFNVTADFEVDGTSEIIRTQGDTVYLNTTTDLDTGVKYYIQVQATAVVDAQCGLPYSGVSDKSIFFTILEGPTITSTFTAPPAGISSEPLDLSFDKEVTAGTGNLEIYDGTNTLIATIPATSDAVTFTNNQ